MMLCSIPDQIYLLGLLVPWWVLAVVYNVAWLVVCWVVFDWIRTGRRYRTLCAQLEAVHRAMEKADAQGQVCSDVRAPGQ